MKWFKKVSSTKPDDKEITIEITLEEHVLKKYREHISYNWKSGTKNKRIYQIYRILPIFLGAFLTFVTAISSTEYISSNQILRTTFAIGTPLLVVLLTISNELFKLSGWGENWRDHITTMFQLEKALDDYLASPPTQRDQRKELEKINNIALQATKKFFKRIPLADEKTSDKAKISEDTESNTGIPEP